MLYQKIAYSGLIAGTVMLAVLAMPSNASAKTVGTCMPTMLKFATSDMFNSTSSGSFIVVPEMSLSFVQGGTVPSCVVVQFSGQAHASSTGDELISIDARLDGSDTDNYFPPQPQLAASDATWSVIRTITLIIPSVAPGSHTIKIFYRSANGGNVELNRPSMIVHYKP